MEKYKISTSSQRQIVEVVPADLSVVDLDQFNNNLNFRFERQTFFRDQKENMEKGHEISRFRHSQRHFIFQNFFTFC